MSFYTLRFIHEHLSTNKKTTKSYHFGNFFVIFVPKINVRVIAKRTLRDFWKKHADSEQQLTSWYQETEKAEWNSIHELKTEYPNASILKDNRIVFNVKGNNYRLIVKFNFEFQICWIRFIGTHAEYDKINANEI